MVAVILTDNLSPFLFSRTINTCRCTAAGQGRSWTKGCNGFFWQGGDSYREGSKIPDTFTGDESNLNASIYCNHDSAGDIASRIKQGASAFKVWFPIELGGITLPTDKENDTNVTQRDGATYGLYSNGGTTDQKIKVTGEVCSYEPYDGNAVKIDTTDLSFTMPSSKVTLMQRMRHQNQM